MAGIHRLARRVLRVSGLRGWKMELVSPPGLCIHEKKVIWIPETMATARPWQAMEYVLHETAHALVGERYSGHGPPFYDVYIELLGQHMARRKGRRWR